MPPWPRINILLLRFSLEMWNVDQSYMTIILNLMLSRIAGQIASRMKYLRNAGKFAKCGTITQKCVTGGNPITGPGSD